VSKFTIPAVAIACFLVGAYFSQCRKEKARSAPDFLLVVEDATPEMWTTDVYP
jgi:hypothetical protein